MKYLYLTIFFLIVLSSVLIFYKQSSIPQGLNHDENELARVAFNLENRPYTPFTPVADGHPTPYFYILLLSFKTFGINKFALRLPSRIFGIISILFFYLISVRLFETDKLRKLTGYFIPILLTFMLLTSRWYLHFIRFSFEMPYLLMCELISLYFAFIYIKKKNVSLLIISSILAGLAFNSYQPGRIFFLIPLAVLIVNKVNWKHIFNFLIIFIICILPMSIYLLQHPANDIRINEQLFLKNSQLSLPKKVDYLTANIASTSLMFFTKGDVNGVHNYTGKPAINPVLGLLCLVGLIISLIQIRKKYNLIFVLYFCVAIFPTILTYPWENPNMLRTYTVLPSLIYFAAQTILLYIQFFTKRFKNHGVLSLCFILLLIGCSSFYEMRTYFVYQPLVFKQSFAKPDYLNIIRQSALKVK